MKIRMQKEGFYGIKGKMIILCIVILTTFFINNANALIYDDFNTSSIDTDKWNFKEGMGFTTGLFSQSEGTLNFNATNQTSHVMQGIYTTETFTKPLNASLQFFDFSSSMSSSYLAMGFGQYENFIEVCRVQTTTSSYFMAAHGYIDSLGGVHYWASSSQMIDNISDYGQLGLIYDGTIVTAAFKTSMDLDPNNGWTIIASFNPQFSDDLIPQLGISADSHGQGNFSFKLDNVTINSVPEPASMLLLGLGLIGLAGARRKFQK